MRLVAAALTLLVSLGARIAAQDQPLVVGRDVEPPKKLYAPNPAYPAVARQSGVQGLILLAVTLSVDGRPSDIKVVRGVPLLDLAAIEAVKTWRYAPSVVNDVARRVELVEAIDFFLDDGGRASAYASLASDRRQPSSLRVFAISGSSPKSVIEE
jgi:TonB family protein